jgi:hypothetical protein
MPPSNFRVKFESCVLVASGVNGVLVPRLPCKKAPMACAKGTLLHLSDSGVAQEEPQRRSKGHGIHAVLLHADRQAASHAAVLGTQKRQDRCSQDSSTSSLISAVHAYGAGEEEAGCGQPSSARRALARSEKQCNGPWRCLVRSIMPSHACVGVRETKRSSSPLFTLLEEAWTAQQLCIPTPLPPIVQSITLGMPWPPQGRAPVQGVRMVGAAGVPGQVV